MKCEEFSSMLDAYLDGELSTEDIRSLTEHASACEGCSRQLEAAKLVRDMMRGMDDDIAVPLEAQAAWRNAVKQEARRKVIGRRIRAFTAVAAAVVVLIGSVTLIGNRQSTKADLHLAVTKAAAPVAESDAAELVPEVVLASDGESAMTDSSEAVGLDYTCRRKYSVKDVASAEKTVAQLAGEYDGTIACELSEADEAVYRVEIPFESMDDFLSSVGVIGNVRDSEETEWTNDPAIIYIHIQKA